MNSTARFFSLSFINFFHKNFRPVNFLGLALFTLLILALSPAPLTAPRFWAEEASVYFLSAYTKPWYLALVEPHQGYYSLVANGAGLLATLVPLEYAPYVTTAVAFMVQAAPFFLVFTSSSSHLDSSFKKILFALAIMFVGATGELWLNSITSQFHLSLLTFLILLENKQGLDATRRWLFLLAVSVSGLTGVVSCILAPFFLLRYARKSQALDRTLFVILAVAGLIQVVAVFAGKDLGGNRFSAVYGASYVLKDITLSLLQYPVLGRKSFYSVMDAFLIASVSAAMLYALWRKKRLLYLGPAWTLAVLSILASFKMAGSPRYIYVPSVIVSLFLINSLLDETEKATSRLLAAVLASVSIGYWSFTVRSHLEPFYGPDWPEWQQQVHLWRTNQQDFLRIHPPWNRKQPEGRRIFLPRS